MKGEGEVGGAPEASGRNRAGEGTKQAGETATGGNGP